jgi:hypothetical protein
MRCTTLLAVILVTGAIVTTSAAAPADSRLIRTSPTFQRLGDFRVTADPTYRGAIKALGPASSCALLGAPSVALAVWRQLGVSIKLATFGGLPPGETGCTAPAHIWVWTIRVTSKTWFTSRQLRVGSPVATLRERYPKASKTRGVRGWYSSGYWLVTKRQACIGVCDTDFETVPVLVAETGAGRVRTLVLVVGAQGD